MKNCVNHQLVAGHKLPQRYFLDICKCGSVVLVTNRGLAIPVSEVQSLTERGKA